MRIATTAAGWQSFFTAEFWPGTAPPTLFTQSGPSGFVTLTWTPAIGTNWVLQERRSLSAGIWTNSPSG